MNQPFRRERESSIQAYRSDADLQRAAQAFLLASVKARYSYNFDWLSRPIIQYPQDIVAVQEIIWQVQPDLVIETGIAHGGSLVLSASMLALLDYCEAATAGTTLDPRRSRRQVLGIDIDIRPHNRQAIEAHPLAGLIRMVQGSAVDPGVVAQVREAAAGFQRVLVFLDSNHTHEHVLAELEAYAPLTSLDSYCCVFDTVVEDLPEGMFSDRPWGRGNNPKTAVREYLRDLAAHPRTGSDGTPLRFEPDRMLEDKLLVSVAPEGYLRRVR
jgi:cephalosporin hydroxylase